MSILPVLAVICLAVHANCQLLSATRPTVQDDQVATQDVNTNQNQAIQLALDIATIIQEESPVTNTLGVEQPAEVTGLVPSLLQVLLG